MTRFSGYEDLKRFVESKTFNNVARKMLKEEVKYVYDLSPILELEIKVVAVHRKGKWTREVVK